MRSHLLFWSVLLLSLLAPLSGWAASEYKVVRVESWDTLNMRAGPAVKNNVVARLPHNATGVTLTGAKQKTGRTQWVEVLWQGNKGWVSKAYLGVQSGQAKNSNPSPAVTQQQTAPAQNKPDYSKVVKKKHSGMWILECGNASPFWKVDVLPEWMSGTLGKHVTGMPITHKRQEHGKYHNVAIETEIRGANRWNKLRMTMRYTKSCYSRLAKRKLAFSVEGMFNNEKITGCCRALQVP